MRKSAAVSVLASLILASCGGGSGSPAPVAVSPSPDAPATTPAPAPAPPVVPTPPTPAPPPAGPLLASGAELHRILNFPTISANQPLTALPENESPLDIGNVLVGQYQSNVITSHYVSEADPATGNARRATGRFLAGVETELTVMPVGSTGFQIGAEAVIRQRPENSAHASTWTAPRDSSGVSTVRLRTTGAVPTFGHSENYLAGSALTPMQIWNGDNGETAMVYLQGVGGLISVCVMTATADVYGRSVCSVWRIQDGDLQIGAQVALDLSPDGNNDDSYFWLATLFNGAPADGAGVPGSTAISGSTGDAGGAIRLATAGGTTASDVIDVKDVVARLAEGLDEARRLAARR